MGKQNLFVFGVDANDVPRLREERKSFKDYDPRWTAVMESLLSGTFGDKAFFQVGRAGRPVLWRARAGGGGAPHYERLPCLVA